MISDSMCLYNDMIDLSNTMLDLASYMIDLSNTMLDLASNDMIDLSNDMLGGPALAARIYSIFLTTEEHTVTILLYIQMSI